MCTLVPGLWGRNDDQTRMQAWIDGCGPIAQKMQAEAELMRRAGGAKAGKGEGDGGTGSDKTREELLAELQSSDLKAYYTYAWAERKLGTTTDRQAHQWLMDNVLPDERDSPELATKLAGYKLPPFDNWSRYLRSAGKALGEQKHSGRAGRATGGSVVQGEEIDHQGSDDE